METPTALVSGRAEASGWCGRVLGGASCCCGCSERCELQRGDERLQIQSEIGPNHRMETPLSKRDQEDISVP